MRELFRCALNGIDLLSLDPRLYIQDIREQAKIAADAASRLGFGKIFVGAVGREELTVTILFMVKERNREKRQRIISQVNGWASEGWLAVSTRPDQRLYAVCTKHAESVAFAWHEDMTLVFTACGDPYWQDKYPVTVSRSGNGNAVVRPLGARPCCMEADITAGSSAVSSLSLSANGRTLAFSGLSLAAGKTMKLYYDEYHVLRASVDGSSVLSRRTPESADDIWLYPTRDNTVSFSANNACSVKLIARGEYD